jgi:hypothetical protein
MPEQLPANSELIALTSLFSPSDRKKESHSRPVTRQERGTTMKKVSFATIAASALAALTIGLAAPAIADPSDTDNGPVGGNDTVSTSQTNGYPTSGRTPYGTYQNPNKTHSPHNR